MPLSSDQGGYVRFGSKADICSAPANVGELRPVLTGSKQRADFLDSFFTRLRIFGRIDPASKVPAFKRCQLAPFSLRLRGRCKRFMKTYRHNSEAAGTPLSRGKSTRDALDPT